MKVALCFYGLLGGTKGKAGDKTGSSLDVLNLAYKHFKEHLLDVNDIDVFIHSWDEDLQKEIIELYNPVKSKFEKQKVFSIESPLVDTPRVQNHYSRWYSSKEVIKLKSDYEKENNFKYDFVALSRQDIAWQTNVNFSEYETDCFYVPNWRQHFTGELMGYPYGAYSRSLQDIFFFGNSDDINQVVVIYDNIVKYSKESPQLMGNKGISNHRLLFYQLEKMDFIFSKLRFALKYDRIEKSDMPLVRWKYFNTNI